MRVGSDLLEWTDVRAASGALTVLALTGFAAFLAAGSLRPAQLKSVARSLRGDASRDFG